MDAEQTLMRVQERLTRMLRPTVRATLEYLFLFFAITLFCLLVVLHANYVQQPGCSSEFSIIESMDAQIYHIKITSAGLWSQNHTLETPSVNINDDDHRNNYVEDIPNVPHPVEPAASANEDDGFTPLPSNFCFDWIGPTNGKLNFKFLGPADTHNPEHPNPHDDDDDHHSFSNSYTREQVVVEEEEEEEEKEFHNSFVSSAKETFKAALLHFGNKWHRRVLFIWRHSTHLLATFWKLWLQMQNVAGIHLNLDIHKFLRVLHLDRLNSYAVQWLENGSKTFEPTYLYTMEKGYFLLPEGARTRHGIKTVNVSISARHSCFGNRWQQLIINRFVGYDTILINSLLTRPGQGYLYNYQSNEFYNLSHAHEPPEGPGKFGDYLVIKCGVLMMSLFVFFTTTMSVSFTLRETQTRMLKFTVQLQHHARHRLPTFQLIFVHVVESLVFVPIMIGILFFLFEFYDDQLLAFMVLILVWLCELFTLISVRTPISMKFFPRFFLLYFLVFHIYFFSYAYGFSYVALSTTAAFMQHLILYFWNRFEVPALQRFMQNRRSQLQQNPDFHITSSTILASTLHITRLNTRPPNPPSPSQTANAGLRFGDQAMQGNSPAEEPGQQHHPGQADRQQGETGPNPGSMNSISSLLLWILGGASSEGLTSFLSMFRDVRDQGHDFAESPRNENRDAHDVQ